MPRVRVGFILNSRSGTCDLDEVSNSVTRISEENNAEALIYTAGKGDQLSELVDRALGNGAQIVVAGGGDGTISAIAAALVGTDIPLGVIPLGTFNHFAKDMRIPLDTNEALANVFAGKQRLVDVGEVNGKTFVNNSSIGLYPRIVEDREANQKLGAPKWLAFAKSSIDNFLAYSLVRVSLATSDGREMTRSTPFVFVGNNRFTVSGSRIGTRERMDEGRLWICLAPKAGRFKLAFIATLALLGRVNERHMEALQATEVEIATRRRRLIVSSDGEVARFEAPLMYRTRPKALRIIGPPDSGHGAGPA